MHVTGIGRPEFRRYAGIAEPLLSPVLDNSFPPRFKCGQFPAIFGCSGMGNLRALSVTYARVYMNGAANSDLHVFRIILQHGLRHTAPMAEISRNAQLGELLQQAARCPWRKHRPRSVGFMADGNADLLLNLQRGFEKTQLVLYLHAIPGTMGHDQFRIEIGSPAYLLGEGGQVQVVGAVVGLVAEGLLHQHHVVGRVPHRLDGGVGQRPGVGGVEQAAPAGAHVEELAWS